MKPGWPARRGLALLAATWLLLGRSAPALAAYGRLLTRWPDDAAARAGRAHLLAQLGQRDEAIADAQALVDRHPQRGADDWFNLAYLLEAAGALERAEPAFERCLAMNPALDRAWYGLGLVLMRQRRFDEAATALRRSTVLQPMGPHAWVQLARLHMQCDEVDEAQRIVSHLGGFEPAVAAGLARELGGPP
jgi:tetratricopeptide (TPR) repeat protein